jgi:hypothetical protein
MADPFKVTIAIVGLLLVALFGVWLVMGRTGPSAGTAQQADPEAANTPVPASQRAIPPLDVAVAAKTETATFALG